METERVDRVLIIDDEEPTREVLERGLRRLGCEVEAASDGEEGLALAVANPPDIIISDIRMPRMDGHTLLRRLKSRGLDCAVIMMSADGGMDDVVDSMRNGAVDYLKKPWLPSDLAAAVARAGEIAEERRRMRGLQDAPVSEPRTASSPGVAAVSAPRGAAPQTAQQRQDATFADILGELRRGELSLPAAPGVLHELRSLLATPTATLEQVVSLVERDQRSAIQVIRLANSVQFAGLTRVVDLRTAIARVGFRQVESLAQTAYAQSCLRPVDARFRPLQAMIWKHSVARAVSMRALADLGGPAAARNPGTAYLAGLMSDVGAALLLWVIAERTRSVPAARDADVLVDCTAMIRVHHQEVGAVLLRAWNMEPLLALVAASHHANQPAGPASAYWSLGIVASRLAEQLTGDQDVTEERRLTAAQVERASADLGIGDSVLKRILPGLKSELAGLLDSLA